MKISLDQTETEVIARVEDYPGTETRGQTPSQALKRLAAALERTEVQPKPYLAKTALKDIWLLATAKGTQTFIAAGEESARQRADDVILREHGWQPVEGLWRRGNETRTLEEALLVSGEGPLWLRD